MKKLALALCIFIGLIPFYGKAATDIQFQEASITFSLPDAWEAKGVSRNSAPPKMDSTDPLFVSWRRSALPGKNGNRIFAGLNITVFNVQPDTNVVLFSNLLMHRRGWPYKEFLTAKNDGIVLPNSMAYLTEYPLREDLLMKVFVVHAINDGKFVEINLSATDDIFLQVEPELRSVLKNIRLTK